MTNESSRPDDATLYQLYVDEQLTVAQVAARLGVSSGLAHKWLLRAQVPMRRNPYAARTDVDDERIRRLYVEQRRSAADIAAELGCGSSTIYDRLEALGVERRPASSPPSRRPADSHLADLLVRQQLSVATVAAHFRVSPQAVYGWVRAAGIQLAKPGADIDWGQAISLYKSGLSAHRIARMVGRSPLTVYRHLEQAGVARRPRQPAISRRDLLDGLAAGESAPAMAARLGVSATTVCRELKRHGLQTARQARRARAAERYAVLLEAAITSGRADDATLDELRRRATRGIRSSPPPRGADPALRAG